MGWGFKGVTMKKHSLIFALALCLALTALVACTTSPTSPSESDTAAETWLCACGLGNSGKFCPECGEAKPEEIGRASCRERVCLSV